MAEEERFLLVRFALLLLTSSLDLDAVISDTISYHQNVIFATLTSVQVGDRR